MEEVIEEEVSRERMIQRVEKCQPRKWSEDCLARIFSWFKEYDLLRKQGMQESQTGKEKMRQQHRMTVMTHMASKINSKSRVGASSSWSVSELLVADCQQAWLHPGWEDTMLRWYKGLYEVKQKDWGKRMEV